MKIALLGAESTGKTWLAEQLAAHFEALGRTVTRVDEVLRHWCVQHQRTPQAHEQAPIAHSQAQAVLGAPAHHVVIADTTPLMTAIYSDMLFDDRSLYDFALAHQRAYDVTLLTGLDLPWVADGLQRDGPQVREPVTQRLRQALGRAGVAYCVVYGQHTRRLENALNAIYSIANNDHAMRTQPIKHLENGRFSGVCACGGDPACERRLLSQLLRIRTEGAPR